MYSSFSLYFSVIVNLMTTQLRVFLLTLAYGSPPKHLSPLPQMPFPNLNLPTSLSLIIVLPLSPSRPHLSRVSPFYSLSPPPQLSLSPIIFRLPPPPSPPNTRLNNLQPRRLSTLSNTSTRAASQPFSSHSMEPPASVSA